MRLTNKVVEEVISEVVGEDVVPLVKHLKNKKNVSEFKLAEAIKKEINVTRNMLYRLYDNSLVSSTRKKDKKKGWYIYYWTFNVKRIKDLMKNLKKQRIERLKERLVREEKGNFFVCPNECMRINFDQATGFEFKCPECGVLMSHEDNKKIIKELKEDIKATEKELKAMK